jgi:hypothetical protein
VVKNLETKIVKNQERILEKIEAQAKLAADQAESVNN